MRKLILISSLLFTVLTYSQPTGEMEMNSIKFLLSYDCNEIIQFIPDEMSLIDKQNKNPIINFYYRNYEF